jgi:hypothetical protein
MRTRRHMTAHARPGLGAQPAYVVIDVVSDASGIPAYGVWVRRAGLEGATLYGRHPSLAEAKASVPVEWHEASSDLIVAWGFLRPDRAPPHDAEVVRLRSPEPVLDAAESPAPA